MRSLAINDLPSKNKHLMQLRFTRLIIFVRDIIKLKQFYVDVLGFQPVEEIENEWLVLQCGVAQIALHKAGEAYLHNSTGANNNTKAVFEIEEDIHELRKRLLLQNVIMREIKSFESSDFIFCDGTDPEGNVFQIKQKKFFAE
jgi:catechol 2,3-dioxygenase-like lactoylglutathione lyase family enzyme